MASLAKPYGKTGRAEALRGWQTALLGLIVVVAIGLAVHLALPPENRTFTDAYYEYVESQRILQGQNPYARIMDGDMRQNQKYAAYMPVFYLLGALAQRAGLVDYVPWVTFWRYVFIAFALATGCLLYYIFYRRMGTLGGIAAALFWYLSRWNLHNTQMASFDFIPVFCMLFSLWLLLPAGRAAAAGPSGERAAETPSDGDRRLAGLNRRLLASLLLLGVSLAFKHLDAWLVPLYLIYIWQATGTQRPKALLSAAFAIGIVPLVLALPFVVAGPEAFLRSMLFQLTRNASAHVEALSLDSIFGWSGIVARLPLFAMLAIIYVLFWRRKLPMLAASLMVMAVFIDFNSVLFLQYFSWLLPIILLAVVELAGKEPSTA